MEVLPIVKKEFYEKDNLYFGDFAYIFAFYAGSVGAELQRAVI
jgi:hypothetical protein